MGMSLLFADLVLLAHLAFIVFVVAGGLLALRWPRAAWLHLPAAAWGAAVEFFGWICPLTPLESYLRATGGEAYTEGDFIARILLPLIYPDALTRDVQLLLGVVVLAGNAAVYAWVLGRRNRG
jgi:hypothetical protein